MTKKEFMSVWALPVDIRQRTKRIKKLRELIENAGAVSETVQSSVDAGNATIICHSVVSGKQEMAAEREHLRRLERELAEKNAELARNYPAAVEIIESCPEPDLRCALHLHCLDGEKWETVAAIIGKSSGDAWRKAVDKFLTEALSDNSAISV